MKEQLNLSFLNADSATSARLYLVYGVRNLQFCAKNLIKHSSYYDKSLANL